MSEESLSAQNAERMRAAKLEGVDLVKLFQTGAPALIEAFPHVDPNLETQFISGNADLEPLSYRGIDGFVEGWRDWLMPWSSYLLTARELLTAANGDLVAVAHADARTSRDGVAMSHEPAGIFTFQGELIVRARFFLDAADALSEAGIER